MRLFLLLIICTLTIEVYSQNEPDIMEEFVPIIIEDKEAFISTKTGEFIFLEHEKTDPTALKTSEEGVVYIESLNHKVKKGETLYFISKKYKSTVSELKRINNLTTSNLKEGQVVKIIKKKLIKSSSPVVSYSGEERIVAKLKPGQSPFSMNQPVPGADSGKNQNKELNISDSDIDKTVENKASNNAKTKLFHIVKSGETLFSIAKNYEITVQELKELNNLSLNTLSVGQKLKLK